MSYLLQDCKVVLMLRHAVDDKEPAIQRLAIDAIYNLLCTNFDEHIFDVTEDCWRGYEAFPLSPTNSDIQQDETQTDGEKVDEDIVVGLLDTALLGRLRYDGTAFFLMQSDLPPLKIPC